MPASSSACSGSCGCAASRLSDRKPIRIRYLGAQEEPREEGAWLVAVDTPGLGCELIACMGPDTMPVTFQTGLSLEKTLEHAAVIAADFGVETIYVLGAVDKTN